MCWLTAITCLVVALGSGLHLTYSRPPYELDFWDAVEAVSIGLLGGLGVLIAINCQ